MEIDFKTPSVGFGTYPSTKDVCTQAVKDAIEIGYRIIDTATRYRNFDAIAKAIKDKKRSDFYIISKVWHDKQAHSDVLKDLEFTLKELQTDYIDAYLVHWPNSKIPIEETLSAMNELRSQKKIRHIGLSNVTVNHLKRALLANIPITWVQIEMNPYFYDPALLSFCKQNSIGVQAWAPLGRGRSETDPLLAKIGQAHGKRPSQVAIRWILQHGCFPLPGSKTKKHIEENFDVGGFSLSSEEMNQIDGQALSGKRARFAKESIGFEDEFDFSFDQCWPQRKK